MTVPSESLWPLPDAPGGEWVAWATAWRSVAALELTCLELTERGALLRGGPGPFPLNPNGAVNGGILAAMADQAFGVLAMRASARFVPATANLQLEFHRPLHGEVTVRASSLPGGSRLQFLEAALEDAQGRRCASARATMVAVMERPDTQHDN
ncbi:PaaI family thioesterase [Aeromicrobium sp. Root495]|uniref:PaaI family thioesterase n=1 Tax=Aeromicrobium sp. Root495 TaxID=1736550 RepID=UPI000B02D216|nr:PaaI family thioesterase [Aeromicrobium sp. Root495]